MPDASAALTAAPDASHRCIGSPAAARGHLPQRAVCCVYLIEVKAVSHHKLVWALQQSHTITSCQPRRFGAIDDGMQSPSSSGKHHVSAPTERSSRAGWPLSAAPPCPTTPPPAAMNIFLKQQTMQSMLQHLSTAAQQRDSQEHRQHRQKQEGVWGPCKQSVSTGFGAP